MPKDVGGYPDAFGFYQVVWFFESTSLTLRPPCGTIIVAIGELSLFLRFDFFDPCLNEFTLMNEGPRLSKKVQYL
jgi:hypothetical protein